MRRAILACLAFGAGCTVSNPGYEPGDDAASPSEAGVLHELGGEDRSRSDGGPGLDSKPAPDTKRPFDLKPFPDSQPWQCKTDLDCDDKLPCTLDTCGPQKKCASTVQSGCLIFGSCFAQGAANPLNPCELCVPSVSKTAWTPASEGTPCPVDGLSCTLDVCRSGSCAHELSDQSCLIGGSCFASGASNPANSCQACSPSNSQSAWTMKQDGASCASDGLWCTVDSCKAGVCSHALGSSGCLVGGQCYSEGQASSGSPCNECVSKASATSLTFVAGKACTPPSGAGTIAGMCVKSKCAPWVETVFDLPVPGPNPVQSSALNGVDFIPSASNVWTAGEYSTQLGSGGMLLQLGTIIPAVPVVTAKRFRGIKHRLAVGEAGIAMAHDGALGWVSQAKIEGYLAGLYRNGVWGAPLANGSETFFLSGTQGTSQVGIVQCTIGLEVTCSDHGGFDNGAQLGPVFGALGPGGTLASVWALPLSSVTDLYHYPGSGTSWSLNGPAGCEDFGNSSSTPCSQTSGAWRDLFASGSSEAWAVGGSGLLLRWDGTKWNRLTGVVSSQSSYTFTAVFSSPSDGLTTVAATSSFNGRWVHLFNYNQALSRWLGPIVLVNPSGSNNQDEVRDLGGQGYGGLFAVGVRQSGSSSGATPRNLAWAVQLKP
jgi:hypothetical protein